MTIKHVSGRAAPEPGDFHMAEARGCGCRLHYIFPPGNAVLNQLKVTAGYAASCTPVQLYLDGENVGLSASDQCGYWEFTLPSPPGDGTHDLRVVSGCDSCCLTVEIDGGITPVPAPVILYPSGPVPENAPSIHGTALPGSTVRVCVDDTVCETLFVQEDGSFLWQYPQPLPTGDHVVTAVAIDANGVESDVAYQFFHTQASVSFSVTLELAGEGGSFRTVRLELTIASPTYPVTLYYLMLPPGSDAPGAEEIINYSGPGLTDGSTAAGRVSILTGGEVTLDLNGREGAGAGALGLKDGYHYDIYLLAQAGQEQSPVLSAYHIRSMAFDGGSGTEQEPYRIRQLGVEEIQQNYPDLAADSSLAGVDDTARMFRNIDYMQMLYQESNGKYGVRNSMTLDYALTSPIDLAGYVAANDGTGWWALGYRENETEPVHFTGVLSGSGDETPIRGLTVIRSSLHRYEGLFAYSRNAIFKGLSIQDALIRINRSADPEGQDTTLVGLLSAHLSGVTLSQISVTDSSITIGSGIHDFVDAGAGGMVGLSQGGLKARDLYAENIRITITHGGYRTGGLFGRIGREGRSVITLEHALVRRCIIHTENQHTGGIAGQLQFPKLIRDLRVEACEFTGTNFVAGIVGQFLALYANSSLAEELHCSDNSISVMDDGDYYCGGLFGQYNMEHAHTIRNCTCTDCRITGGFHIGGFAGGIELTGPQTVENCHVSGGSVQAVSKNAGGFIGEIRYLDEEESAGLPAPLITGCTVQMSAPVTALTNAGGFAGIIEAIIKAEHPVEISHCTTTAPVQCTDAYSGGFTGNLNIGHLTGCTASGDVHSAAGSSGGIFGSTIGGNLENPLYQEVVLENCVYSGSIQTEGADTGGIGGFCDGTEGVTIQNSLVTSSLISGNTPTGRIIGGQSGNVLLNHNYSTTASILQDGTPKTIIEDPNGPDGGTLSLNQTIPAGDSTAVQNRRSRENNSLPGGKGLVENDER